MATEGSLERCQERACDRRMEIARWNAMVIRMFSFDEGHLLRIRFAMRSFSRRQRMATNGQRGGERYLQFSKQSRFSCRVVRCSSVQAFECFE